MLVIMDGTMASMQLLIWWIHLTPENPLQCLHLQSNDTRIYEQRQMIANN